MIKSVSNRHIEIQIKQSFNQITGEFLLQISKNTSRIYLKQFESPKNALGIFGKPQFYWQILAREMIDNGIMRVRFVKGEKISQIISIYL